MSKKQQPESMADQLRQAIRDSGQSLGKLGVTTGVDKGGISRFLRGERDLTAAAFEKLCLAMGLRLCSSALTVEPQTVEPPTTEQPPPKAKPKKKPGGKKGGD